MSTVYLQYIVYNIKHYKTLRTVAQLEHEMFSPESILFENVLLQCLLYHLVNIDQLIDGVEWFVALV